MTWRSGKSSVRLLFGRCDNAVLFGCYDSVAIGRSLRRSVAISLSLWIDCYESVRLEKIM